MLVELFSIQPVPAPGWILPSQDYFSKILKIISIRDMKTSAVSAVSA